MAKVRKPPLAATERLLGLFRPVAAGGGGGVIDLPDLAEADVWYTSEGPTTTAALDGGAEQPRSGGGRSEPRPVGGLSRAFADGRHVAVSAPVGVPAWPARCVEPEEEPPEVEEEDSDGWVPPHVYLARRQARASVVEGAGRTLKGRDLSRVRNAVWSRTGFDG